MLATAQPLSRCDELVAAVLARCVPGSVVTPQGCVLRGLLPSEQFESGQMVLQVSQPEFALQEGDITRRLTQTSMR